MLLGFVVVFKCSGALDLSLFACGLPNKIQQSRMVSQQFSEVRRRTSCDSCSLLYLHSCSVDSLVAWFYVDMLPSNQDQFQGEMIQLQLIGGCLVFGSSNVFHILVSHFILFCSAIWDFIFILV